MYNVELDDKKCSHPKFVSDIHNKRRYFTCITCGATHYKNTWWTKEQWIKGEMDNDSKE